MEIIEGFKEVKNFLMSEKLQLRQKVAIVVLVFTFLLMLNNSVGFTYNIGTNNKIEELKQLNNLISSPKADPKIIEYAKKLRDEVMTRETYIDSFGNFLNKLEFRGGDKSESVFATNIWIHISSAGLWYMIGFIIMPLINIFNRNSGWIQSIAATILGMFVVLFIALILYFVSSLLSYILGLNFLAMIICNCILQIISIYFVFSCTHKLVGIEIRRRV